MTGAYDLTAARRLPESTGIAFMGDTRGGAFDISSSLATQMLSAVNANGRPNSDVVRPWVNGFDVTRRPRGMYIIDFGTDMSEIDAALYSMPFQYVERHVRPERSTNNRASYREKWWLHMEPRPALRFAIQKLSRFIVSTAHAKHRLFSWLTAPTLPDHALFVFARDDDYFFGILHSHAHELWALRLGTALEDRPRYTPSTTFETFPFPWSPGTEPSENDSAQVKAVADAARGLVTLRDAWLNPPNATPAELQKRTLTNLYNQRPDWLAKAHAALDAAVFAAYEHTTGKPWPVDMTDDELLSRLLALNLKRAATSDGTRPS